MKQFHYEVRLADGSTEGVLAGAFEINGGGVLLFQGDADNEHAFVIAFASGAWLSLICLDKEKL